MAEVQTRAKLGTLAAEVQTGYPMATFHGIDFDVLARKGVRAKLELDRDTWESLGRPVDIVVGIQSEHDAYMPDVLREVAVERTLQEASGYDAEHDDRHGFEHLMNLVRQRLSVHTNRDQLVEAAALIVAGVELMDRREAERAMGPVESLEVPQRL